MTEIVKPIIILGTGRCGSTLLHNILAKHPNVAFLNTFTSYFPDKIWLTKLGMEIYSLTNRVRPQECYLLWNKYAPEFVMPFRDLDENDVTNYVKNTLRNYFKKILSSKRNRLLLKITGWPRIGYLNKIFPDAYFIHILRDGRAFVNSIIKESWWLGFRGPQNWRFGELSTYYYEVWKKYKFSFIALAAIQWIILIKAVEKAAKKIKGKKFLEVKYEDLTQNPDDTLKKILEFIELEYDVKFRDKVKKLKIKNMNYKYKEDLTAQQIKILNEILAEELEKKGYKVD